jgi:hypothetical protein
MSGAMVMTPKIRRSSINDETLILRLVTTLLVKAIIKRGHFGWFISGMRSFIIAYSKGNTRRFIRLAFFDS